MTVRGLIRRMYADYQPSVGLSVDVTYCNGTPLRPVVPLDTGSGGLFIIGAYPSSRFAVIDGVRDVPAGDNLGPFEAERWFDGARVRKQPSASELEELFLKPLKIQRSNCWITDLVKVFLFKRGHRERYRKLGSNPPEGYERERFFELGRASLSWVEKELDAAHPALMLTLGAEVAGVLYNETSPRRQTGLLKPEVRDVTVGRRAVPTIHCAHPGILMRRGDRNPWPDRHLRQFVPAIRKALRRGNRN